MCSYLLMFCYCMIEVLMLIHYVACESTAESTGYAVHDLICINRATSSIFMIWYKVKKESFKHNTGLIYFS